MREGKNKDPMEIRCPQFSDKGLMLHGNFGGSLNFDIEHWPVKFESVKGIPCKSFQRDTGVKVTSSVCRYEICEVILCLNRFKIYHTCPDIFTIKKNIVRKLKNQSGRARTRILNQ